MIRKTGFLPVLAVLCAILGGCGRDMKRDEEWSVYKGDREVFVVFNKPGPMGSMSLGPPGTKPAENPYFSGYSKTAQEEDAIGKIASGSKSLREFLEGLRKAGYRVQKAD